MVRRIFTRFGLTMIAVAVLALGLFALTGSVSAAGSYAGHVYTETNAASGNSVLVYGRGADGSLTLIKSINTGGTGTDAGLGSEGALAFAGQWLLAVNAGSNDISVISLENGAVKGPFNSRGTMPISLTVYQNLVYVLNAGSSNISGFRLSSNGTLRPIANSTRTLGGTQPAQVKFTPNGEALVVTEKGTSTIDTFTVNGDGTTQGPFTHASSGSVPFGFDVTGRNSIVVSEAANSAASSYRVQGNGGLKLVSASVVNGQLAACWVVITSDGRVAYTADAHNGKISSYGVSSNGSLTLLQGIAGDTGGTPLDEAVSSHDQFLYVLNPGTAEINAFTIQSGGSLTNLTGVSGIPASAAGLLAR